MNSPSPGSSSPRRLAAVCFADIVGFTRLSAEDEPQALRLVEVFQTVARGATEAHGGSVVKFMGDGALAAFTSVKGASSAAIQLQLHFKQVTRGWSRGPHRLRVGVHLGDITVAADGDMYGDGVNRASRLQDMAEPGQILVSEDVFRQLRQRPEVYCTDVGSRVAKGIDEPIKVYRLEPGASLARALLLAAKSGSARTKAHKRYAKPISVGMAVGIMTFMTLGAWTGIGGHPEVGSQGGDSYTADRVAVELVQPRASDRPRDRTSLRGEHRATYSCLQNPPIRAFARGGPRRGGNARTPDVRRSDSRSVPRARGRDGRRCRSPESR